MLKDAIYLGVFLYLFKFGVKNLKLTADLFLKYKQLSNKSPPMIIDQCNFMGERSYKMRDCWTKTFRKFFNRL